MLKNSAKLVPKCLRLLLLCSCVYLLSNAWRLNRHIRLYQEVSDITTIDHWFPPIQSSFSVPASTAQPLTRTETFCQRHTTQTSRVIGLCVTLGDHRIATEWLQHHMASLKALFILDSSPDNYTRKAVLEYKLRCPLADITYFREDEISPAFHSDQSLRGPLLRKIRKRFGVGYWILIVHFDEFLYHEPDYIAQDLVAREYNTRSVSPCLAVRWTSMQVIPHPSEYERYMEEVNVPLRGKFQHYHSHSRTHLHVSETRMFRDIGIDYLENTTKRLGVVPPQLSEGSICNSNAFLLHYKISNPSLSEYSSDGKSKFHWRQGKGGPGVGIGGEVHIHETKDFFMTKYKDYSRIHKFTGCLTDDVSLFSNSKNLKDAEKFRIELIWPVFIGAGKCELEPANSCQEYQPELCPTFSEARTYKKKIDVTFILPYYNDCTVISKHLDSLLEAIEKLAKSSTAASIEYIVVDDGSPAISAISCIRMHNDTRLMDLMTVARIDTDINWNQPGAKNLGAYLADPHSYLVFVDADYALSATSILTIARLSKTRKYAKHHVFKFARGGTFHPSMMMLTNFLFQSIGGFSEDFSGSYGHEDSLFWHLIRCMGISWSPLPGVNLGEVPQLHSGMRPHKNTLVNRRKFELFKQQIKNRTGRCSLNPLPYPLYPSILRRCFDSAPALRFPWHIEMKAIKGI